MDNKRKNYAPKSQEGWYTVHVVDNEVKIIKNSCGPLIAMGEKDKKVTVRCHPDDRFDIGEAIKIGLNRLNMDNIIRIGDTVRIVNNGESYCTVTNWDDVDKSYAVHYRFGVVPKNGTIGKVVRTMKDKFVIEVLSEKYTGAEEFKNLICSYPVYLMGERGLEKIKDGRYE